MSRGPASALRRKAFADECFAIKLRFKSDESHGCFDLSEKGVRRVSQRFIATIASLLELLPVVIRKLA